MNNELFLGLSYTSTLIVEKEHTASHYGSGLLDVFATPAMVALMENAAMMAVEPYLPEGGGTVGAKVSVQHIKATPLEMKVSAKAELTKVEGRKLEFTLNAWDEKGEIGSGTHTRYMIDVKRFIEKVGS